MADTLTKNFKFVKPEFNKKPWQQQYYDSMDAIDAILARYILVSNFVGVWNQATGYTAGQRVVDTVGGAIYTCNVSHTSTAVNTFAQDRIANPSFWTVYTFSVQFRAAWVAQTDYSTGDFVTFGQRLAVALAPHHSSNSFLTDQANGLWSVLIDGTAVAALPSGVAGNADCVIRFDGSSLQYQLAPTTVKLSSAGVLTIPNLVVGNGGNLTLGDATAQTNWRAGLGLTIGVAAGNVVALDGSAKLPAVDASQLTNIPGPAAVRQTVLTGLVDSSGVAAHIAASGTALGVDLKGTVTPVTFSWAGGFTASAQSDKVQTVSADVLNYWAALPISATSFLAVDFVAAGTNPTAVQTRAPPQYGRTYDQTKQALLHMEGTGAPLDDYGNTWTLVGAAALSATQAKFGTKSLQCTGAGTDQAINTAIPSMPSGSWTVEGWLYPTAQPALNTVAGIFVAQNVGAFGIFLGQDNNGGVLHYVLTVSSNGTTDDILSGVRGTAVPALNTWTHWALVFDAIAGTYALFINGVADIVTTNSAKVCGNLVAFRVGGGNVARAGWNSVTGFSDEFRISPFCRYPNSVTFTPPVAAGDATAQGQSSDWFDTVNYRMNQVTGVSGSAGSNPAFTAKNRLYVGEADTSGVAVTAVRPYALSGKTVIDLASGVTFSTQYNFNHNIGVAPRIIVMKMVNLVAEAGYLVGDEVQAPGPGFANRRNSCTLITSSATQAVANLSTGAGANITAASWKWRVYFDRGF